MTSFRSHWSEVHQLAIPLHGKGGFQGLFDGLTVICCLGSGTGPTLPELHSMEEGGCVDKIGYSVRKEE